MGFPEHTAAECRDVAAAQRRHGGRDGQLPVEVLDPGDETLRQRWRTLASLAQFEGPGEGGEPLCTCLLYTSDAADE